MYIVTEWSQGKQIRLLFLPALEQRPESRGLPQPLIGKDTGKTQNMSPPTTVLGEET